MVIHFSSNRKLIPPRPPTKCAEIGNPRSVQLLEKVTRALTPPLARGTLPHGNKKGQISGHHVYLLGRKERKGQRK